MAATARTIASAIYLVVAGFVLTSGLQSGAIELPHGVVSREFIYESAPFPSCHAATLVETPDGLLAAWFGGTHERHVDVEIWTAKYTAGRWSVPVSVADGVEDDGKRYPTWNPVLFQPSKGPLLLFFKVGPTPRDWWGSVLTSTDAGKTWSPKRRLPDGFLGPIKNKPLELADGQLLLPSSSEHDGWQVHFEFTNQDATTWKRTPSVADPKQMSGIQPSVLTLGNGDLSALGRSRSSGLFRTRSIDGGQSWSPLESAGLPNPSSGTDAVTLTDGRHLLVYNHSSSQRSPLNVALADDGLIWQPALTLEDDATAPHGFAYPAVIQTTDGMVHVAYTWRRERIRHVVIDPDKLSPPPKD